MWSTLPAIPRCFCRCAMPLPRKTVRHGKAVQHSFTFHDDSAMHGAALGYLHRAVGVQQGQLRCIRKLYIVQYCHRITAYLLQQRYALQMAQAFYAVQLDRFRHVAFSFAVAFG